MTTTLRISLVFCLAAVLAPTDAALGQAVVSSPVVPMRIRQALNVESGLNDGIALPFIMLFAAMAAAANGAATDSATHWAAYWTMQGHRYGKSR